MTVSAHLTENPRFYESIDRPKSVPQHHAELDLYHRRIDHRLAEKKVGQRPSRRVCPRGNRATPPLPHLAEIGRELTPVRNSTKRSVGESLDNGNRASFPILAKRRKVSAGVR